MRQVLDLGVRNDPAGSGEFLAPRGPGKSHNGIDYICHVGQEVLSPIKGTVTRIGYAYSDDLSWRYVEVHCEARDLYHRVFYIDPLVERGATVSTTDPIGTAKDISDRYPDSDMLPHIHYEVRDADGKFLNPEAL